MKTFTRGLAALVGLVVSLAVAGVAAAHVEVSSDKDTGGAERATLTFDAEAENSAAGIASIRVVLPQGIAPADVTLKAAPSGWKLTPGADGYTVAGAAQPKGRNVKHSVVVARLPKATELVFKVLVTYGNGDIDRWIEEPTAANPSPEMPAAVLKLRPGPSATPTTTAPATTAPVTVSPAASAPNDDGGGPVPASSWILGVVALLAVVGAIVMARNRSRGGAPRA